VPDRWGCFPGLDWLSTPEYDKSIFREWQLSNTPPRCCLRRQRYHNIWNEHAIEIEPRVGVSVIWSRGSQHRPRWAGRVRVAIWQWYFTTLSVRRVGLQRRPRPAWFFARSHRWTLSMVDAQRFAMEQQDERGDLWYPLHEWANSREANKLSSTFWVLIAVVVGGAGQ